MALQPAVSRQLSYEEAGVIGANAVQSDAKRANVATEVQANPAAADAIEDIGEVGSGLGRFEADFEKFERPEADARPELPADYLEWEGYKAGTGSARDNFEFVIRYPGSVFTAPGRYHNAQKLDKVYDVVADQIVPDGLFLIPTNYLVNPAARGAVLRGERRSEVAPAQPNPLRSNSKSKE